MIKAILQPRFFAAFAALFMLLTSLSSTAQPAVELKDAQQVNEVWPNLSHYVDHKGTATLAELMATPQMLTTPKTAYATLGIHKEPIWLKVPIKVASNSDGLWVLDVDYAPINRLEVYLTQDLKTVQSAVFSNLNTVKERSVNSRSHTLVLKVRPGMQYDLYIRVKNTGAMILPITISKPVAFHLSALEEQILQGFLQGIAICFLIYSILRGMNFRDWFYIKYAILILGGVLFSLLQSGIGGQYIWFGNPWLEMHMGGLSAFVASTGSFLFIEHALGKEMKPWLRKTMKAGAALCVACAMAYCFDLIGIETVTLLVSTLGLVPALLGLPGAISLVRKGNPVGWYFLIAWIMYFVTTAILVEVIKGRIGVSFWTMHSFQFGATFDMFVFMAVLGVQSRAIREDIERTKKEQARLLEMAHSDPLTSLPNRRSLYQTLEQALKNAGKNRFLAVYMMDLDGFKAINDSFGHEVGDELLVAVSKRLKTLLRNDDMVSRLGGDEFVLLAQGLGSVAQAKLVGDRLLEAFNQPFVLSKHTCTVGLTVGYAIAPLDGKVTSNILRQADEAMYLGKRSGKSRIIRSANERGLNDADLLALIE